MRGRPPLYLQTTIKDFDCFLHQCLILPSSLVKANDLKGNRAFSSKDRSVFPLGIEGSVKLHLVVGWSTREIGRIKELQVHALASGEQLRFVKSNVQVIFDPTSRRSGPPVSTKRQHPSFEDPIHLAAHTACELNLIPYPVLCNLTSAFLCVPV